jgi:hypothetical protein
MKYNFSMSRWENPMRAALQAYRNVGCDLIPGPEFVLPKPLEGTTGASLGRQTGFGIHGARAIDPLRYKTPEDVLDYVQNLPSLSDLKDNFNFDNCYYRYIKNVKEAQDECGDDMLWIAGYDSCQFEWFNTFGYQPYLLACLRYKNEMKKLFEYSAENGRINNEAIVKAIIEEDLPPFVYGGQDICNNKGPMIRPKILNEIYFPFLKKALEPLTKAGINIIWHSDGNIMSIIEMLIEIGIEGFQGFQEESGVDLLKIANMKTKSGNKPIIFGSISVTTTLPFGTIETVKKDVERCIDTAGLGGRFFLSAANSILVDVPSQNIFTMYKHGKYYGSKDKR